MAESYNHLADDTYINTRLQVKMDLSLEREAVMGLFERLRREHPAMSHFRKSKAELALESPLLDAQQLWVGLRKASVRTGILNPAKIDNAYRFHKSVLDAAPLYLSISPLDIDYLEVVYGFSLMAPGNHDAIVFDALIAGSPLAGMLAVRGATPSDCQPTFGLNLTDNHDTQALFQVRTRPPGPPEQTPDPEAPPHPISVLLFIRKMGVPGDVKELAGTLKSLMKLGDELVASRVAPFVLKPLREVIASSH
ncbi:MAG: hypothetical protein LW822_01030 [Phycisphaeraceae bacterium]|jgi:hypothetical protein|nr:hypothetical protein [Phycisphaeraceae bacterium]